MPETGPYFLKGNTADCVNIFQFNTKLHNSDKILLIKHIKVFVYKYKTIKVTKANKMTYPIPKYCT